MKTDVLIIGGGMAGVLTAYMLQNQGTDYVLIEAETVFGSVSGKTTAKITVQHGLIYDKLLREFGAEKAKQYYEVNLMALEQYRALSAEIPCDFENQDSYVYSLRDPVKLERELFALDRVGVEAEFMKEIPLPMPVSGAIRMKDQAQFHPMKFAAGILPGLNIYEHTRAVSYDGKSIVTDRGKITANKIIVATHFPIFNKHGAYFLKLYQHRSYVLALENVPEINGMYVDESDKGLSFRQNGDLLLLGGGSHRTGKKGGNWTELRSFAIKQWPKARERAHWATQDCMSLDGVPYIGQYSNETPNLFLATGFNKWGMTGSMAAAMILRDLVQEKENPYSALFSPSRTILRPQLAVNGVESIVHLLTPTKPRCPHLGCALKWNSQERSWDCPCHGSRFSKTGTLLINPATNDLKSPP